MHTAHGRVMFVSAGLVVAIAGLARGQGGVLMQPDAAERKAEQAAAENPGLESMIALLDAPEHPKRAKAAAFLVSQREITLEMIERRLAAGGLSAEQENQLRAVGLSKFAQLERPGLGVQFEGTNERRPIRLERVIEGFPAFEVLRPGDVVTAIAGQAVLGSEHMRHVILSHQPGERFSMRLLRPPPENEPQGDPLELEVMVELGRYGDLGNAARVDGETMLAAYRQRLARAGAEAVGADLIGGELEPLEWIEAEGMTRTENGLYVAPENDVSFRRPAGGFAIGGQPSSAVGRGTMLRGNRSVQTQRSAFALGVRTDRDELEIDLAALRVLARRLAIIDEDLGEVGDNERKANALRVERAGIAAEMLELTTRLGAFNE